MKTSSCLAPIQTNLAPIPEPRESQQRGGRRQRQRARRSAHQGSCSISSVSLPCTSSPRPRALSSAAGRGPPAPTTEDKGQRQGVFPQEETMLATQGKARGFRGRGIPSPRRRWLVRLECVVDRRRRGLLIDLLRKRDHPLQGHRGRKLGGRHPC
jgi:hypothetical protein